VSSDNATVGEGRRVVYYWGEGPSLRPSHKEKIGIDVELSRLFTQVEEEGVRVGSRYYRR
jgi:hypothetical protein